MSDKHVDLVVHSDKYNHWLEIDALLLHQLGVFDKLAGTLTYDDANNRYFIRGELPATVLIEALSAQHYSFTLNEREYTEECPVECLPSLGAMH